MDKRLFDEYKSAINQAGDKPIKSSLALFEAELTRANGHKGRLAEIEAELEAIPGQAEALAESGGGVIEADNLGRRLGELQAQKAIHATIAEASDKRLSAAWQSFEKEYKAWRFAESRKAITQGLETFQSQASKAAEQLAQLAERLGEQDSRLELLAEPGDLARLRGARLIAQLCAGVLLAAQGRDGLITLPVANTGRDSVRLMSMVRAIWEMLPDSPPAPAIWELAAGLGLLALERPEARKPLQKSK